jgi:hypothetical protein
VITYPKTRDELLSQQLGQLLAELGLFLALLVTHQWCVFREIAEASDCLVERVGCEDPDGLGAIDLVAVASIFVLACPRKTVISTSTDMTLWRVTHRCRME